MSNPTELPDLDRLQFRKKPVVIEAIQWDGNQFVGSPPDWIGDAINQRPGAEGSIIRIGDEVRIATLEGDMATKPGDWIIRGVKGELYPCKPDIFAATYELAARRAKPEGEAPQAEPVLWQVLKRRDEGGEIWTDIGRRYYDSIRADQPDVEVRELYERAPAATLSPLCGAQHAESGKEAFSDWEMGLEDADGNPLATVRQDELSAAADFISSAALASVRIDGKDFRREDFVAFLKSRRGQSALAAQQAAAPRTDLSKRIRAAATADVTLTQAKLLIGAAEEIERAQQAAAPGARIEELEAALEVAMNRETVLEDRIHELEHMLDGSLINEGTSAPGTPEAPTDPVVEANRQLLLDRSRVGMVKYGKPLEATSLSHAELTQHALEEALDLANYLQAILRKERAAQLDGGQGEGQ